MRARGRSKLLRLLLPLLLLGAGGLGWWAIARRGGGAEEEPPLGAGRVAPPGAGPGLQGAPEGPRPPAPEEAAGGAPADSPTPGTGRVRGLVLAADDGRPLAGARVRAQPGGRLPGHEESGGWLRLATTADAQGRFELEGLPWGRVATVEARAEGYADGSEAVLLPGGGAEEPTELRIALERGGALAFVVHAPQGGPAPGATVCLYAEAERPGPGEVEQRLRGWSRWSGTTDAEGRVRLPGLPLATPMFAVAFAEDAAPSEPSAALEADPRDPAPGTLRLRRPGRLRLALRPPPGWPPGDRLAGGLFGRGAERRLLLGFSLDLAEGERHLTLSGLEPGPQALRVQVGGCVEARVAFKAVEGETVEHELALDAGLPLQVEVREEDGRPCPHARLSILRRGAPEAEPLGQSYGVRVQARLRVPPGTYDVEATDALGRRARLEGVVPPAEGLDVVLPRPVTCRLALAAPGGEDLPGVLGTLVGRVPGQDGWWQETVDPRLPLRWTQAAGPVEVAIRIDGFVPLRLALQAQPGDALDLGLCTLDRGRSLALRVLDAGGGLVPQVQASTEPPSGAWSLPTGEGRLSALPAEPLTLVVRAPLYLEARRAVDASGPLPDPLVVTLDRGAVLTGRVRTPQGGLALGAQVRLEPLGPQAPGPEQGLTQDVDGGARFALRVRAGRYRLLAGPPEAPREVALLTLEEGEVRRLDPTLPPPTAR